MSSAVRFLAPGYSFEVRRFSPFLVPMLIIWALMIVTFSVSEEFSAGDRVDVLMSNVKYGLRGVAMVVLAIICFRRCPRDQLSVVVSVFAPLLMFAGWALVATAWSPLKTVSLAHAESFFTLCLLAMTLSILCRTLQDTQRILQNLCTA